MHRAADRLVNFSAVAKPDLYLGGVDIDVDPCRVDFQVQHIDWLALAVQHVFECAAYCMRKHLVAHKAPVDIKKLLVGTRARGVGNPDASPDPDRVLAIAATGRFAGLAAAVVQRDRAFNEFGAEYVAQALRGRQRSHGALAPLRDQAPFVPDGEAYIRPRQRGSAYGFQTVRQFGGIGFEKLAPCRRAEKQLLDFHGGADCARYRPQLAAAAVEGIGGWRVCCARSDRTVRYRIDRCQRFSAKAEGGDRFEFAQAADFAGCVALESHRKLLAHDAGAVVLDRDQPNAARQQPHRDQGRPGIEGVVDQFAHHRGRSLDDFARSDLADQFIGQLADRCGRRGC